MSTVSTETNALSVVSRRDLSHQTTPLASLTPSPAHERVGAVQWMIENRGGLACLAGCALVPSQFGEKKGQESWNHIQRVVRSSGGFCQLTPTLPQGVIYYPGGSPDVDRSCVALYHNPNGVVISEYFKGSGLSLAPAEIVKLLQCPIILYDYRGVGISGQGSWMDPRAFRPTYATVVADGLAMLQFALSYFRTVKVIGSSFGGAVATISLESHLQNKPEDAHRVSLFNHDSFRTSAQVMLPSFPSFANWVGWAVGGLLDAETAMKSLIQKKVVIAVASQDEDPIIPVGARMTEIFDGSVIPAHVRVITVPEGKHANLSPEMVRRLEDCGHFTPGPSARESV